MRGIALFRDTILRLALATHIITVVLHGFRGGVRRHSRPVGSRVMRVLVIEDDQELGPALTRGLREAGFAVDFAGDLAEADVKLAVNSYDCVIADRILPDGDALTLLAAQRTAGSTLPVLLLTALDAVTDRVTGFEHGA